MAKTNFYLSECPGKDNGVEELKKLLKISMWQRNEHISITEYPVNFVSSFYRKQKTCSCGISSKMGYSSASYQQHTLTPTNKKYKCPIKIEDKPRLVNKLKKYFQSKGTLVEICKSRFVEICKSR